MKLLNLTPADRVNCSVFYNVNRFEVYHVDGWMMTAAQTAANLEDQLLDNQLVNPTFSLMAAAKYIGV